MDGIDYKTTDMAKWGAGSGAGTGGNLTPLQVDLNFWTLYERLKNLEDNPPEAVNIASMSVVGSQWLITMTDASTFGPFDLPLAIIEFKGDWLNNFLYHELDVFSVPQVGLFMTRIEHTTPASPAEFDPLADDGSGNLLYLQLFGDESYLYDFGLFYPGKPGLGIAAGAALYGHVFARPVTLLATLPESVAKLAVGPVVAMSFPIEVNGDVVGSVDFAINATDGTFTFVDDVPCVAGDVFVVKRDTNLDVAARELNVTFVARRDV